MMRRWTLGIGLCVAACGQQVRSEPEGLGPGDSEATDSGAAAPTSGDDESADDEGQTTDVDLTADLGTDGTDGTDDDGMQPASCEAGPVDGVVACSNRAAADSFDPVLRWAWEGDGAVKHVAVTPLVANLTDDNGDGAIDLCDIPDVVVVAYEGPLGVAPGHIYVLDGATGALHFRIEDRVSPNTTPAIGDLDGDGLPEIVTIGYQNEVAKRLVSFDHEGTLRWSQYSTVGSGAVSLADLDNDGDPEIFLRNVIWDHDGILRTELTGRLGGSANNAAVDLDGDGDLELVGGHTAWHHDGSVFYAALQANADLDYVEYCLGAFQHNTAAVADVDGDGEPEIMLSHGVAQCINVGAWGGLTVLGVDGVIRDHLQIEEPTIIGVWSRPPAAADLDGDGLPDLLAPSVTLLAALSGELQPRWTTPLDNASGYSAVSAFDFLGDGTAEALAIDATRLLVVDGITGATAFEWPRSGVAGRTTAVVADVDNNGSADILVTSSEAGTDDSSVPAVQMISDRDDRWVAARRIWNQEGYHVTNVHEDATIPTVEPRHWEVTNTFRVQAQREGALLCVPPG